MCGFSVRLSLNSSYQISYSDILNDLKLIQHRGYDDSGIFGGFNNPKPSSRNPFVALGHRRLAIIDPSSNGKQPIASSCGRYVMVFNGEIYNYTDLAKSYLDSTQTYASDSRVLLELWVAFGQKILPLLKGFFSACIFDARSQQLFAFRDAFGIKPLWMHKTDELLHLCSETPPFLNSNNSRRQLLDPHGLASYLTFGYSLNTIPILKNTTLLKPGFLYQFSAHSLSCQTYLGPSQSSFEPLEDQILNSTSPDVPAAAFFSGGLDSSAIATVLKSSNVPSLYCVNYQLSHQYHSEEYLRASQNAKLLGLGLSRVDINAENFFPYLDEAISSLSSPVDDSAIAGINSVARRVSQDHIKVLLGGLGGDELFCGYSRYFRHLSLRKYFFRLFKPIYSRRTLFSLSHMLLSCSSFSCYRFFNPGIDSLFSASGSFSLNQNVRSEVNNIFSSLSNDLREFCSDFSGVQNVQMFFDIRYYLHDLLLLPFDNILMHHTLEGRPSLIPNSPYPYLSLTMPSNISYSKPTVRQLLSQHFPEALKPFPKSGFGAPFAHYIATNLPHVIERIQLLSSLPFFTGLQLSMFIQDSIDRNSFQSLLRLYCLSTWIFCN